MKSETASITESSMPQTIVSPSQKFRKLIDIRQSKQEMMRNVENSMADNLAQPAEVGRNAIYYDTISINTKFLGSF